MTINQLINIADKAYGDGAIKRYHDGEGGGDGLAHFIAVELKECCEEYEPDRKAMLTEALRVMEVAIKDLERVHADLFAARYK